jgi:folate-binding protein YgfZ
VLGYTAAHRNAAVSEQTDRAFVRVYGRDPVRMLQGLISNDLARADGTRAVYAAVLTPKGKMVCDVRVLRLGDELLVETDSTAAAALIAHLKKFVPPLFARFDDVTPHWSVLGVYGPHARELLVRAFDAPVPENTTEDDAHPVTVGDAPLIAIATSHTVSGGFDLIGAPAAVSAAADRLRAAGAETLDAAALDVLRIEAGRPRWGVDMDENTIPLEAGLRARAISETKGCYTGQEVIVRILHRGHVNRLLRGVLLGELEPPAAAAPLLHPGDFRKIGRITSVARSPALGQTVALAYVRREVEPPAEAHLELPTGPRVQIVTLPFRPARP